MCASFGDHPTAHAPLQATLQGIEAVAALLAATPETPSPIIGVQENKLTRLPLVHAVEMTQKVAKAIEAKDFKTAMSLRDAEFADSFDAFAATTRLDDRIRLPEGQRMRIAILQ